MPEQTCRSYYHIECQHDFLAQETRGFRWAYFRSDAMKFNSRAEAIAFWHENKDAIEKVTQNFARVHTVEITVRTTETAEDPETFRFQKDQYAQ